MDAVPDGKKPKPLKFEMDFFEVLIEISKKRPIFLTVPETFYFDLKKHSTCLICTNYDSGQLIIKESITKQILVDSLNFFEDLVKMNSKYPIAISKVSNLAKKDTCVALFKTSDCIKIWNKLQNIGKNEILQRFIPSSWDVSLFRCSFNVITKECKKVHVKKTNKNVFEHPAMKKNLFTNVVLSKIDEEVDRASYCIKRLDQVTTNFILDNQTLDSSMAYLANLIEKFYYADKDIRICALQADWIQDPKGNFFLINVKSYQMKTKHTSFTIDRPIFESKKTKADRTYNEMILRRSLSPPYSFSFGKIVSAMKNNISVNTISLKKSITSVNTEKTRLPRISYIEPRSKLKTRF